MLANIARALLILFWLFTLYETLKVDAYGRPGQAANLAGMPVTFLIWLALMWLNWMSGVFDFR